MRAHYHCRPVKSIHTLFLFISISASLHAQNLFDAEHSRRFADFLFNAGQYDAARGEYERVLFLNPKNDSAKFRIGDCFLQTKNYSGGIERLRVMLHPSDSNLAFSYSRLLVFDRQLTTAWIFADPSNGLRNHDANAIRLSVRLVAHDVESANFFYDHLPDTKTISTFESAMKVADNLKHRSPVVALGLSTIIPGTGKIYTGNWKDGLISMMLVSFSAWQSFVGFDKKGIESAYGWIYGGIGLAFYSGNLFGSWKAARVFNHNQNKKLEDAALAALFNYR